MFLVRSRLLDSFLSLWFILTCSYAGFAQSGAPSGTSIASAQSQAEISLGYTLLAPTRSTKAFLLDNNGNVAHQWTFEHPSSSETQLLNNGNILRASKVRSNRFKEGGAGGRMSLYDWDGQLLWEYVLANDSLHLHHDMAYLPNGNILVLALSLIHI